MWLRRRQRKAMRLRRRSARLAARAVALVDEASRYDWPISNVARSTPGSLPGLAHPLRVQLLDQLTLYGPATATQLGVRLHESSGATSYHLRQLERYGFVEEDSDRGSGRERWWRVAGGLSINAPDLKDQPGLRDRDHLGDQRVPHRGHTLRAEHWRATFERWPREWQDASAEGAGRFQLTAAEIAQLSEDINELLTCASAARVADRVGDEYHHVEVQHSIFPLPDPVTPGDSPGGLKYGLAGSRLGACHGYGDQSGSRLSRKLARGPRPPPRSRRRVGWPHRRTAAGRPRPSSMRLNAYFSMRWAVGLLALTSAAHCSAVGSSSAWARRR